MYKRATTTLRVTAYITDKQHEFNAKLTSAFAQRLQQHGRETFVGTCLEGKVTDIKIVDETPSSGDNGNQPQQTSGTHSKTQSRAMPVPVVVCVAVATLFVVVFVACMTLVLVSDPSLN